jgi:hypothetical protein
VITTRSDDADAHTIVQVDGNLVLGCTGCGAERRVVTQPTPDLLDGIQAFVHGHAACS